MMLQLVGRTLRVKYLAADRRFVDADRMVLEKNLKRLIDVTLTEVKSPDDPDLLPCDLLVVAANSVATIDFKKWLEGLRKRVQAAGNIWVPVLILTQIEFEDLRDLLLDTVNDNWYFDVIHTNHLSSLPIRVANLLKIHDHLHEMQRYEVALDDLGQKVAGLEAELKKNSGKNGDR